MSSGMPACRAHSRAAAAAAATRLNTPAAAALLDDLAGLGEGDGEGSGEGDSTTAGMGDPYVPGVALLARASCSSLWWWWGEGQQAGARAETNVRCACSSFLS